MESAARRFGAYGGEFSPIGLRLFAWWKKQGKKRLQKLSSRSTKN
jgi:hypothetical protein